MKNSKLIITLRTLDGHERNALHNYLQDRISDKTDKKRRLFDYLNTNINKDEFLTGERIYAYVFRDKNYNPNALNTYSNQLLKYIEDFIIYRSLTGGREEEVFFQRKMILIQFLKNKLSTSANRDERLLDKYYNALERLYKDSKKAPKKNVADYMNHHLICQYLYNNIKTRKWATDNEILESLSVSLDIFICVSKLKQAAEKMVRGSILNEKYLISLYEPIKEFAKNGYVSDDLFVKIYSEYHYLLETPTPDIARLQKLENLVCESVEELDKVELNVILLLINNYASQRVRTLKHEQTNLALKNVCFNLLRLGFEHCAFEHEGFINPMLLINFCRLATSLDIRKDMSSMIRKQYTKIKEQENHRKYTEILCETFLKFNKGEYEQSCEILWNNTMQLDPFYMHYRILRIKNLFYIEDGYLLNNTKIITIEEECQNYLKSLQSKEGKYNETLLKSTKNFIAFVKKLSSYEYTKGELRKMLAEKRHIIQRDWLHQIIEDR